MKIAEQTLREVCINQAFPDLYPEDAARTVHCVGRVVEHSVPVQRPQPDVGEEKKSRYEQPGELQQPLLLPPHLSGRKRVKQRRWKLAKPPTSRLFRAETTFTLTDWRGGGGLLSS